LLNRAIQPKGIANTTTSIIAVKVNDRFNVVCNTRFKVENVSNRKTPFSQKLTYQPLVLKRVLMMNMFKTPNNIG